MKQSTAVMLVILLLLIGMTIEGVEDRKKYYLQNRDTISQRMQVFEKCMERNKYDYTDALCELCYDSALAIIPYSKYEIKQAKKDYRAYKKWAKTKAVEPVNKETYIKDNL